MTKFRKHRGSLEDALATTVEVANRDDLLAHVLADFPPWWGSFEPDALEIRFYCYDERIGWDTYIVTIKGHGVIGFTDGPL